MKNSALGLIEVTGYLGIIAVADTALKAAGVSILQVEKISGGLSTLQLTGDVGAVQAAVEAGEQLAITLGCHLSSHVIPRVDLDVLKMITIDESPVKAVEVHSQMKEEIEQEKVSNKKSNETN